jgi:predicted carbohydrate-binding protein with CBM5 and CBM33 domain
MPTQRPRTKRGRRTLIGVLAAVPALVGVVLTSSPAAAHGAPMTPGSRTFLCWQEGLTNTGEIKPNNPACASALATGGTNAFYNWFGVLQGQGSGRTRGFIPDGKLCSGNNPTFAGFDAPRADWPVTHLTSGASYEFTYNMWAAHPGSFSTYVTKDGYDPTKPLTWDSLEDAPFDVADHPPSTGAVATLGGKYYWTAKLPAGKTGRHLMYTVWTRSDSNETFYSCSDVVFDGGKGEVTGVGPGSGTPSGTPSVTPSVTPSGTSTPSDTTMSPPPAGGIACTASYRTVSSWTGGYQGEVTVRNTGTVPLHNWMIHFSLPPGQSVTAAWGATVTTDGAGLVARSVGYNSALAVNASTTFGYLGSTGTAPSVSAFSCMPA